MALIVEDGTGMLTAESYLSVADFKTRATDEGFSFVAYSDALIEQALRRSTIYLDGRYRFRFMGYRTKARLQALEWPRLAAYYASSVNGYPYNYPYVYSGSGYVLITSNEVPRELVSAQFQATKRELTSPNSLTPDVVASTQVVSETVGPISVTYKNSFDVVSANRPVLTIIDELLAPFITSQNKYSGTAVRG